MTRLTKRLLIVLAISLLGLGAYLWMTQIQRAPDARFNTLYGQHIDMHSLQGKVVLVNFWATDCVICNAEMPELVQTYQDYQRKGFEVIAVAMPYDPPGLVVHYIQTKKLPFPVAHDQQGALLQQFGGVTGTPTAYLYDKQGKLMARIVGKLDFVNLRRQLDKELS